MEFNKCGRCGNFYVSQGNVCPTCSTKDTFEYSTFKSYLKENNLTGNLNSSNLETISIETGITIKNLNRFLNYGNYGKAVKPVNEINNFSNSGLNSNNIVSY